MAQAEQAQFDLVKITNRLINNELKINYQNQTYSALEVTVTDTNGTTQSMFQLSPFHSWRTSTYILRLEYFLLLCTSSRYITRALALECVLEVASNLLKMMNMHTIHTRPNAIQIIADE